MGANKKINQEDIRQYVGEDLDAKIKTEQADLQKMKFGHAVSSLDNPLSVRAKRRNIARLLTEQTNRKKNNKA
ncbi:MAG: 50S ribosomal protein L29 [Bacteroidetes bacterium]|nr:50S ribosomal protein L29 [Bacteroidota bacterium]